jgi:hypothetical protein
MKAGPETSRTALGNYYDAQVKAGNLKAGDLVYTKNKGEPTSHFAIYLGKDSARGVHRFGQMGVDGLSGKVGSIAVTEAGAKADKFLVSGVVFVRAPKHAQPQPKYSPTEIASRVERLIGKDLNYDSFNANCESWANMIVTGKSRSTQANRLSLVGKSVIRATYRALEDVAALDPNYEGKDLRQGKRIPEMARWLDRNNPRGNDMGHSAMVLRNKRLRNDAKDEFLGLVDPSTVITEDMSDIEAISATKRWLMVLTAAVSNGST